MCLVCKIETFYCDGNSPTSTSDFDAHLTNVTSTTNLFITRLLLNKEILPFYVVMLDVLKNVYAAPKHSSGFLVSVRIFFLWENI